MEPDQRSTKRGDAPNASTLFPGPACKSPFTSSAIFSTWDRVGATIENFQTKDEAVFAGYERFIGVLLNRSAYIGVVYTARQLASDALDEAAEPDLSALGDWLTDLLRER
jgi:hypothetical protein